jgi:nucleoside-diphosphate-sugar epimerase
MRIAMSGISGFIGKNLYLRLKQEAGTEISIIDHHNLYTIEKMVADADAVVHLAAAGTRLKQPTIQEYINSLSVTEQILKLAPRTAKLIVAGSVVETMPINSLYAASKAMETQIARSHGATVLRFTTPYGPFEQPHRIVPQLIANGLAGRLPDLSDPENIRDFIHVDDVVSAILQAVTGKADPGIYTIASGERLALKEVVDVARKSFKIDAQPNWGGQKGRPWEAAISYTDPPLPSWKPTISFEVGFEKTKVTASLNASFKF